MNDDLARRVARLEDEREVLATLYRYGHTIDARQDDSWLELFTADGVYDIRYEPSAQSSTDRPHRRHVGAAELAEFITTHSRAYAHHHKHLLIEPLIEIDGTDAAVTSYFLRIDGIGGERVIYAFGRYVDRLTKGGDGRWRFASRIVRVESSLS